MASKAQIKKKEAIARAKAKKAIIDHKYETTIPKVMRSGNVRSIIRKVEQIMSAHKMNRQKISQARGKRMPCKIYKIQRIIS